MTDTAPAGAALRILHVMAPSRAGGLESVVVQLTGGLRARGHDVQVAAVLAPGTEHEHPVVQALQASGVPVHVLVLRARDYLGERRAVRDLMRTQDLPLLHTHGYRADVVLGDVARRCGRGNVMTLHGFVGGSRRSRAYEWAQLQAARYASAVVGVSTTIVGQLQARGITRNVRLLRNAVPPLANGLDRAEARRQLGVPLDVPLVGWVGRLSREKGPDLFLTALERCGADVHGVVIGDGPLLDEVRARARASGVSARLTFTGLLPQASRYLPALDVLASTSRTEGTPMILLEAMRSRIPVVATAVGGVPDVLANGAGVLVPVGDGSDAAAPIMRCLADPAFADALREAATRQIERAFSFGRWIESHERLYRDLGG